MHNNNRSETDITVDFHDYETILKVRGKYSGFNEYFKVDQLEEKFEIIKDIQKAKRILIQFEIPENLSLSTITNFMSKVNDRADINTDIIFGTKTNKNLEEDEIFIRVLMSGL